MVTRPTSKRFLMEWLGLSRLLLGLTGSCPKWLGRGRLLLVLTGLGFSGRFDMYFAENEVTVQNLWPFEVFT